MNGIHDENDTHETYEIPVSNLIADANHSHIFNHHVHVVWFSFVGLIFFRFGGLVCVGCLAWLALTLDLLVVHVNLQRFAKENGNRPGGRQEAIGRFFYLFQVSCFGCPCFLLLLLFVHVLSSKTKMKLAKEPRDNKSPIRPVVLNICTIGNARTMSTEVRQGRHMLSMEVFFWRLDRLEQKNICVDDVA